MHLAAQEILYLEESMAKWQCITVVYPWGDCPRGYCPTGVMVLGG